MKYKVFICGNFGYKSNQVDGQTLKTRILKETLQDILGKEEICYVDTSYMKDKNIKLFIEMREKCKNSKNVIILPGQNGLLMLLPFFVRWKKKYNFNFQYVVIGGWLADFIKNKKVYINLCKKIDGIHVETKGMLEKINMLGIKNASILKNMKKVDNIDTESISKAKGKIKIVFLSRVIKEKGVEIAIEAICRLNHKYKKNIIFDIYGPCKNEYKDELEKIIEIKKAGNICYKGALEPDEINATLKNYDLMVFPTYYEGEGFPGAIIDAYINGLPVIASDWKYNNEVIENNKTGLLFNEIDEFVELLSKLIDNPNEIDRMKKNTLNESLKYNSKLGIGDFINKFLVV